MTAPASIQPIKVLLVEDNSSDAELAKAFLTGADMQPLALTHARGLQQAIECLKREGFSAILADLDLPDSRAIETFRRIHAEAPDASILVLTGLRDEEVAITALREGAQDYLIKGQVDGQSLRRSIHRGIERKRAEARIRWLTLAVEQSPAAVFLTDLEGRIEYVNRAFTEVTGYAAEEVMGQTPRILTSGLMSDESYRMLWRTILAGSTWRGEVQNRRKDGSLYWGSETVSPIRDPRRVVTHFLAVQEDITARIRAVETIAEGARLARFSSDIGVALTRGSEVRDALQACTDAMVQHLDAAFARVWTLDAAGKVLDLRASSGLYTRLDGGHSRVPMGEQKIGLIAKERRPHLTNAVIGDPRVSEQEWAKREGMVAFAGYPLVVANDLVGVIAMFARRPLNDSVLQALSFVADIIAVGIRRKQAEAGLKESEASYRLLMEQGADAIATSDSQGHLLEANQRARELMGYSAEEIRQLSVTDMFVSRQKAVVAAGFSSAVAGVHHTQERTLRRKDGTEVPVEVSARRLPDGRLQAIVRDITERKRNDDALRESEARFRQLAEHIREAFFLTEADTLRSLYVSPTWAEIFGCPVEEAYATPGAWFGRVHPEDRPRMTASLEAVRRGEETVEMCRIIRPDASERWVRARTFPIRGASGAVYRLVGVLEDITDLRRAEQQAMQAQRMETVGRLAGGVAHDFNNLLTVIMGEVELTMMDAGPSPVLAESLGEIKKAAERASVLTRQLLMFSRRQLVEPVVFNLNDVVSDMNKMLVRLIGEDVLITTRLARNPGLVRADRGQIEQVLTNLAINARDAMPGGGTLMLQTEDATLDADYARSHPDVTPGPYVMLAVSDTGTGMTAAVQARIFEPFFTTKESGKGTGLGLATSFGIVKQGGGHINVYSEVGIGTTVRVYLPRVDGVEKVAVVVAAAASPRGDETILLVEDEAAVRRVAARILRAEGYGVLEARDAEQAMALFGSPGPGPEIRLLLTDVVLPGLGGRQLSEQIKAIRPDIKVLFASGYTDDVILQHQLLEKGIALVQKPFTRELLARKVREVLDS